jgi:hypothetical protein
VRGIVGGWGDWDRSAMEFSVATDGLQRNILGVVGLSEGASGVERFVDVCVEFGARWGARAEGRHARCCALVGLCA